MPPQDEAKGAWASREGMFQAAFLCAEEGLSPGRIAARLGKHKSVVSRWLRDAREAKILVVETKATLRVDESVRNEVQRSLYGAGTLEVLQAFAHRERAFNKGRSLMGLHVVMKGSEVSTSDDFDLALVPFGTSAAATISRLLEPCECVGISWGRTMRVVVDALIGRSQSRLAGNSKMIFPLWGEAWGPEADDSRSRIFLYRHLLSASVLARDLANYVDPSKLNPRFSLESVPTALPTPSDWMLSHRQAKNKKQKDATAERFSQEDIDSLGKYFRDAGISSWSEIFGRGSFAAEESAGPDALVSRADMMILALGTKKLPGRFLNQEYLNHILGDEQRERLLRLVCGDIGGVLLEENPKTISSKDQDFLSQIRASWTGVRAVDLKECVVRAASMHTPGVVACGLSRPGAGEVALEVVRHGLASQLVVDELLALELRDLAERELSK